MELLGEKYSCLLQIFRSTKYGKDHLPSLPYYASNGAAGMDVEAFFAPGSSLTLNPGERCAVPTGLYVQLMKGYEIQVRPRSGMSLNSTLLMPNSPGTIDSDYRGETKVIFLNNGTLPYTIKNGDRIAQWVVAKIDIPMIKEVSSLEVFSKTTRGTSGFGSTGFNNIQEKEKESVYSTKDEIDFLV